MSEFDTLFYRDSYCREFTSRVKSCQPYRKNYAVELEETAFYPEGGGQPGDTGTLNGKPVSDTRKIEGRIMHILSEPMEEGTEVHGVLDWENRLDHMVMHSAEHMVSGLIHKTFGYDNVGFHMGEDAVIIDFNGPMDWNACMKIEAMANALVRRNLTIRADIPGEEELHDMDYRSKKELSGEVRIVTVPEADVCACCGTHLRSTGEIGYIKLISLANHKNGVRIEMLAGKRAEEYMRMIMDQNMRISHLLSAKMNETAAAAEKLQNSYYETRQKLRIASEAAMRQSIAAMKDNEPLVVAFAENADHDALRYFANAIIEEKGALTAAALCEDDGAIRYVIVSHASALRPLIKDLNKQLKGRGGGSDELVQGMFACKRSEAEAAIYEVLGAKESA